MVTLDGVDVWLARTGEAPSGRAPDTGSVVATKASTVAANTTRRPTVGTRVERVIRGSSTQRTGSAGAADGRRLGLDWGAG